MTDQQQLQAFWDAYRHSLPEDQRPPVEMPEAWYFCDSEPCANELVALVLAGIKTATASLGWVYEVEDEALPQVGQLDIVTDWAGEPQCIIEITDVWIAPFNEVDARQAYEEGEGDRSLDYWRRVHWDFFSRECAEIEREPSETMPVVCERFRVVYAPGT